MQSRTRTTTDSRVAPCGFLVGAAGMTRAFSSCRTSAILASDTSRSYTGRRSSTCSSNAPRISASASLLAREAWPRTNYLSATPSTNVRYLRAPRKGGAFHWVRAPPGARSIRKQSRMRLIAGQEPVHAQERRFDRPVAAHDHGSGFVRNGDPARRTDAQTDHGAASNLLKSFRDQAALHGQLEVETLDVIKPDDHGSEAASRRTALRRHVCRRRP